MELLPAIDLREGGVVRLQRGDDKQRTVYSKDPVEVLQGFSEAGVERVHVVDLDAAFGESPQRELIERMASAGSGLSVQLGGGLRDRAAIDWAFGVGVDRVVVTSMIVRDFDAFAAAVSEHPGKVVAALDVDGGELRTAGWTQSADRPLQEICEQLRGLPLAAVLTTDISRDGMLQGPNFELAAFLGRSTDSGAILSGGVGSLGDIRRARHFPEICGVIVGKALYDGQVDLAEALELCAEATA